MDKPLSFDELQRDLNNGLRGIALEKIRFCRLRLSSNIFARERRRLFLEVQRLRRFVC